MITRAQIPTMLANYFVSLSHDPLVFQMLINALLLTTGMFLNASASVIILATILVSIADQLGISIVFLGVLMTVNLAIGCVTPPVGVILFFASTIARVSIAKLARAILPFLAVLVADLVIITYVPGIIMWLPTVLK